MNTVFIAITPPDEIAAIAIDELRKAQAKITKLRSQLDAAKARNAVDPDLIDRLLETATEERDNWCRRTHTAEKLLVDWETLAGNLAKELKQARLYLLGTGSHITTAPSPALTRFYERKINGDTRTGR